MIWLMQSELRTDFFQNIYRNIQTVKFEVGLVNEI